MAEPFLSEIRIMSFSFAPKGWALCNGQLLPINQNQALFSLLGTTYGGDGRVTFALPDLHGRTAVHIGDGLALRRAGRRDGSHADDRRAPGARPRRQRIVEPRGRRRADEHRPRRPAEPDLPRSGRRSNDDASGDARRRRRQPAAPEHAAVPRRSTSASPYRESSRRATSPGGSRWHNRTSVRFGCSRATSRRPAGCSATASCSRSPRTRRCST